MSGLGRREAKEDSQPDTEVDRDGERDICPEMDRDRETQKGTSGQAQRQIHRGADGTEGARKTHTKRHRTNWSQR